MDKRLVGLSKSLSLILRQDPGAAGIAFDAEGWARSKTVLVQRVRPITRAVLDQIVASNREDRFALSADGSRIRARQGHSPAVDLGLAPLAPPDRLCHGTADADHASIRPQAPAPASMSTCPRAPNPPAPSARVTANRWYSPSRPAPWPRPGMCSFVPKTGSG